MTEEFLRDLFDRFLAGGDEEAMDEFVRRTRPKLLAVAKRIGAPQDAEDAVQAAYLALIRKRPDADLMAWLVVVVVRTAYRRKAIDRRQTEIARKLALPAATDEPASGAEGAERSALVRRDVARLPAMYRDPIVLHYFEGMGTPEIARLLDLGDATVRTRLYRGRALLRGRLPVSGLLVIGWFCRDALALGEIAMKTKTALVAAVILFLVATGVAVRHSVAQREPPRAGVSRAHAAAAEAPASDAAPAPDAPSVAAAEGPRVTGTVLGKGGAPVAGARVSLFAERAGFDTVNDWTDAPRAADARAETDDAGRFGLPAGEDVPSRRLLVEAGGYSPAKVEAVRPGDDVVVTLEPGPTLSGRVTNLDGAAIARARVTWWTLADLLPIERTGVTDALGFYRLEGLPSHWVFPGLEGYAANIRVDAEGYPPLLANAVQPSWREQGDLRMDLILVPGSTLRGRVLNGHTGEPLEGARVAVRSAPVAGRVFTLAETATGRDGLFTIEGLPADGFHALPNFMTGTEWKAGTARAEKEGFAAAALDIDALEPGSAAEVEIRCWPTGRVTGRVVDVRGEAIEGVRITGNSMVQGRRSAFDPAGSYVQAATDARGLFQLASVPAPGTMQVSLYRDGWPGKLVGVEARPGETVALGDIAWDGVSKPAVEVEVVDAAGDPVWNATVEVEGRSGPVRTDREGRARLWTDEPGPGRIEAWHPTLGFKATSAELRADIPETVRIALEPPQAIEGVVRWEDGSPAAVALVQARGQAGDGALTRCDREGRFVLRPLRAGSFDVTAQWFDTLAGSVEATAAAVQAGSRGVALVLPKIQRPPTVAVEGTVRSKGTPVLRFDACLYSDGRQINAERPAPGRFRFPEVPVGTWKLRVTARGYAEHEAALEFRLGTPTPRLEIELGPAARVHGRAKGAPGGMMALRREDGFQTTVAFVQPDGRFAFDGVPGGRYRPYFLGLRGLAPPIGAVVEIEGGGEVRFDFELVPGDKVILGEGTHKVVAKGGTVILEGEVPSLDLAAGDYEIDGKNVTVK